MALEVREKSASPVTNAVKCGQGRKAKPLSSWASVCCSRSRHTPVHPSQGGDTGSNPVGAAIHPESGLCQAFAREIYTVTTSTSFSRPRKSSGFRVYRGNSAAHAVAAIRRSTARAPRALRPLATTAA